MELDVCDVSRPPNSSESIRKVGKPFDYCKKISYSQHNVAKLDKMQL